jgi:hypothetical protein
MSGIKIIGAGLAGLLAARMLRDKYDLEVHEAQSELPNNHSAVLRFRTDAVAKATGIEFKKVKMIKHYVPWLNPVADALAYSRKVSGVARSDRSITSATLEPQERWIAPPDLVSRLAVGFPIIYKCPLPPKLGRPTMRVEPIISTIPMPALMDILEYPHKPEFKSIPGWNLRACVKNCDAYVSLYIPDPDYPFSRISLTGNELIVEFGDYNFAHEDDALDFTFEALCILGILKDGGPTMQKIIKDEMEVYPSIQRQQYAKILPIDEGLRRHFMHWATVNFNIYSLGRYATWRPGLLLDDLVKDITLIDRWIKEGNQYGPALHR